jgi:hypothetical protein
MKIEELAHQVLKVLDGQQEYFRTRAKSDLENSKMLADDLRKKCIAVLAHAEPSTENLFAERGA